MSCTIGVRPTWSAMLIGIPRHSASVTRPAAGNLPTFARDRGSHPRDEQPTRRKGKHHVHAAGSWSAPSRCSWRQPQSRSPPRTIRRSTPIPSRSRFVTACWPTGRHRTGRHALRRRRRQRDRRQGERTTSWSASVQRRPICAGDGSDKVLPVRSDTSLRREPGRRDRRGRGHVGADYDGGDGDDLLVSGEDDD